MTEDRWFRRWGNTIAKTEHEGVFEIAGNKGFLVRVNPRDPTTGKCKEIRRVLPGRTIHQALVDRDELMLEAKSGQPKQTPGPRTRFVDFAAQLLENKVAERRIKSSAGRETFYYRSMFLIVGREDIVVDDVKQVPVMAFGEMFIDQIRRVHIDKWTSDCARRIAAGQLRPSTANGYLATLRVIMKAAKRQLELPFLATEDSADFDESEHPSHTEEEPNSLEPNEVPMFLECMKAKWPQHFAMTYTGLATGLRPCTMRPLRRQGEFHDVKWLEAKLLIRRSHTRSTDLMNTTKTGKRITILVPDELIDVLRWHTATQLVYPEQRASDLLFPSITGGFRSPNVLNKPIADVAQELGLRKHLSQYCLRRTYNDLSRAAGVHHMVQKSISGHVTDEMVEHYSTIAPNEQREAISRILGVMGGVRLLTSGRAMPGQSPPCQHRVRQLSLEI